LKDEVRMRVRVIAEHVAAGGNFPDEVGTRLRKFSDQKESGPHRVAFEQVEQPRRDGGVGTVIKRESKRLGGQGVPYRGTE
jgi:hypothetical protein